MRVVVGIWTALSAGYLGWVAYRAAALRYSVRANLRFVVEEGRVRLATDDDRARWGP